MRQLSKQKKNRRQQKQHQHKRAACQQRRKEWVQLIEEAGQSGESVRKFCGARAIQEHNFYRWRRRLRQEGAILGLGLGHQRRNDPRNSDQDCVDSMSVVN